MSKNNHKVLTKKMKKDWTYRKSCNKRPCSNKRPPPVFVTKVKKTNLPVSQTDLHVQTRFQKELPYMESHTIES